MDKNLEPFSNYENNQLLFNQLNDLLVNLFYGNCSKLIFIVANSEFKINLKLARFVYNWVQYSEIFPIPFFFPRVFFIISSEIRQFKRG